MRYLIATTAVITSLAVYASTTWACSPPGQYYVTGIGSPDKPAISTDGTFIYTQYADYEYPRASLHDADGVEIPGALDTEIGIVRFSPSVQIEPGDYTLVVTTETYGDEIGYFRYDPDFVPSEEPNFEFGWHEQPTDPNSCLVDQDCAVDSCGGGGCYEYWHQRYDYLPVIGFDLSSMNFGSAMVVVRVRNEEGHGAGGAFVVNGGYPDGHRGEISGATGHLPLCLEYEVLDGNGNVLKSVPEVCYDEDDFPAVDRRTPDYGDKVARCVGPPADTTDPEWVARRSDGGGCTISATAGRPWSATGAVLIGVALLCLSRRRSS